jgi:hypothetical protein
MLTDLIALCSQGSHQEAPGGGLQEATHSRTGAQSPLDNGKLYLLSCV